MTLAVVDHERLGPYVPRLVSQWLAEDPDRRHRRIPGTVMFADISGFTALTEALARRGKIGAEEMGDILNQVFEQLLAAAYAHGAGLVKWGGDTVLLLFDGPEHPERAAAAAAAMQRTIRRAGRVRTSGGNVQLRMSIGVHTGEIDFVLAGDTTRELIVIGPAASQVALLEKGADADEVLVSEATAEALQRRGFPVSGPAKGEGFLLGSAAPVLEPLPINAGPIYPGVDLGVALPPPIRDHLLDGAVDAEHRHVTVGFIEFSGTDAFAGGGRYPELTAAVDQLISTCQRAAGANGVTMLSTDVNIDGGKVILISGAPMRAGDDEARLLTAVREVLDAEGPLSLRAGVTSGRVFAGDYGPAYRRNYSVAGDCVNLAARLMGAAEPGQLLTTSAVLSRAAGRFVAREVPPFHVKGKQDAVVAFHITGFVPTRDHGAAAGVPLVGRQHELAVLMAAVPEVVAGRGRAVDLIGPGGIGKTRLIAELSLRSGLPTLWADGDIYGETAPYKPIRAFVRTQLDLGPDAPREEVAARFEDLVRQRAPEMVPWLALLGVVVDAEFAASPEVRDLDPGARKERMEWAVSELLGALATDPTILVFNDAHLMDDATVDLIRRLTADAAARPWLVVTSYRPDDRAQVADGTTVLALAPLGTTAAASLAEALTADSPLPSHQLAALLERAGGNPLYISELVAAAVDGPTGGALPDSIEGLISARIDRLSPSRRRLLRAASVLGMVVDLPVLAAALEADGSAGGVRDPGSLRDLREFVTELDGERVQFTHHLVRESAYEGLSFRRRGELHGHVAVALEAQLGQRADEQAALLSVHCLHGARYQESWRYSLIAAERARRQYANAEAADSYDRALTAAGRLRDRSGLDLPATWEGLADVSFELGEFERTGRALRKALGARDLGPSRARLCMKVALVEESSNRYSSALRWLTKGLRCADEHSDADAALVEGQLMSRYARVLHVQGRNRLAVAWARRAVEAAERSGDEDTLASALESLDRSEVALGHISAESPALRSLAIYEARGDLCAQGRIHNTLGMRAYYLGRWPEALERYRAAEAVYQRAGRVWSAATCQGNLAEVLSDQGHLEEAQQRFEAAMRIWRGVRADTDISFGQYMLGRIAARQGRFEDAHTLFALARRCCLLAGEQLVVELIDALVGEALVLEGRYGEALALVEPVLDRATHGSGLSVNVPLLHRVRALALRGEGRVPEAVTALRASLDTARRRDAQHHVALALRPLLEAAAATDGEAAAWRAELQDLSVQLGLVATPPGG